MPPIVNAANLSNLSVDDSSTRRGYNTFLLFVAGLGGLLYGIDVGIIGGALPYLEATSKLSQSELSIIVAAVLLGTVFSTLFAGMISDWIGRRPMMILSGVIFAISIPVIAGSHGFQFLFIGRLLQGMSGGLIGVIVPLYLAECLSADKRGRGTGAFQWMLTFGIVVAAFVGIFFSYRVAAVEKLGNTQQIFDYKDHAWRMIFWVTLPPSLLFIIGSFIVSESPRWLFKKGKREKALAALLRSRSDDQANFELSEIEASALHANPRKLGSAVRESLFKRKYVVPFLLACVILACNTATGVNSVIGYNTAILLQSGLSDLAAHWGYVVFTVVNFLATMIGMTLVDKKGRKFLLSLGTGGVIIAMIGIGLLFRGTEKLGIDTHNLVQSQVTADQSLKLQFDSKTATNLLASTSSTGTIDPSRASLSIIYSYGDYTSTTSYARSDDAAAKPIVINRTDSIPANKVQSFFQNPFADLNAAQTAPLKIQKALVGVVPDASHGWRVAFCIYFFIFCYAFGPGVVVWLALSELMPTRIRSNGMSFALVLNQMVSTTLAAIFLPFVGRFGYSSMFFLFGGFTVIYFLVSVFFLPETKGKTLEEIEAHFAG
jgi:MFS transporter, SP family, solute carrier family 2 (myo-inositol transporter), member 13